MEGYEQASSIQKGMQRATLHRVFQGGSGQQRGAQARHAQRAHLLAPPLGPKERCSWPAHSGRPSRRTLVFSMRRLLPLGAAGQWGNHGTYF